MRGMDGTSTYDSRSIPRKVHRSLLTRELQVHVGTIRLTGFSEPPKKRHTFPWSLLKAHAAVHAGSKVEKRMLGIKDGTS